MLKKILNILKSTFLIILLGGISIMPWLGYLEVPVMNEDFLILSWLNPHTFFDSFRHFFERIVGGPYWRPVVWTVNSITKYFAGYHSWPYHLTNIFVYGFIVFAFFDFLKRIGFARRRAWLGAFIFAVLPAHELSVAWIAGRTDTFMAMFLLFGMNNLVYAYKNSRYYFIPAVFFFLFALLSKEPAFVVPAMPFMFLLIRENKLTKQDWKIALHHFLVLSALAFVILLYRYIVIGGTPFESSNFASFNIATVFRNLLLYVPVSFLRADQLEKIYYYVKGNSTALYIIITLGVALLSLMIFRFLRMEKREKHLLLFGFLWYLIFILPAVTFFGQWYAFTSSMGLIIMLMSFLKLDANKIICKYTFYFILSIGIIVSVINSARSNDWLDAAERADIAFKSIEYKPKQNDTLIFLGVPDKLNNINMMKIGFSQAVSHYLNKNKLEISSPLRLEMSDDSFISIEKTDSNEIVMEIINGRFLPVGSRSRAIIVDEKLHYEDGFQRFDIFTKTTPIIVSKAHILIKDTTLLNRVFLFNRDKFVRYDKLRKELKTSKFNK